MSKILILARTGFGKSTSFGEIPELKIKGLNPKETYLISVVNKPLPFRKANDKYKLTTVRDYRKGNRVITNDAKEIAYLIEELSKPNSPFINIIFDDMNYVSQDYYMKNAMKGGWDTPKQIGYGMGLIFSAINKVPENKNIICMAHYDAYRDKDTDTMVYKYKSTGGMVDEYICPEGKFEIVLYGKSSFDDKEKHSIREFVTNDDGKYPAKTPFGMFEDLYINNDLGYVIEKVLEYYN